MLSEGVHENSNERVWLELRAKISFFENVHFLKMKIGIGPPSEASHGKSFAPYKRIGGALLSGSKESLSVDRPHRASEREIEILIARHAREVASLRHDLLHAQKKATLGEMLSIASHEFNNSLTTIINYAKIGIRHKDVPTRDKALEKILSSGNEQPVFREAF